MRVYLKSRGRVTEITKAIEALDQYRKDTKQSALERNSVYIKMNLDGSTELSFVCTKAHKPSKDEKK